MIRLLLLYFSFLLLIFSLTLPEASAQQVQPDTEQSLLPDIDPQDIEIRSQFQARFPGLRRQPILGFNPTPRVFQTDPDRMPFIEDEETVMASLPIGELDRPEPPVYRRLGYADPKIAFFRGGIGSEISPEADQFAVAKLSDRNWLSGSMNFRSSDGHEENVTTSYRFLDADLHSFNKISTRVNLRLGVGVTSDFNHMPQLVSSVEEYLAADTKVTQTGFRGSANLDIAKTSLSGIKINVSGYAREFTHESDISQLSNTAGELGIKAGGEYSRLGNNINEIHRVRLQTHAGNTDPVGFDSGMWSVTSLSAHYERLLNFRTDVKASLGLSGVSDIDNDFIVRFTPELEIKHTFFTGFSLRAKAFGYAGHYTLAGVQAKNRFFDMASPLKHYYEMTALGEIQLEPFYGTKIIGGASFQDIKNYLYYSRSEAPFGISEIDEGYFHANFENAAIFKVYGGFAQDLKPEVFWISVDGHWQVPRLSDSNTKIPYVENLSLKGTVSLRPTKEVLLEGWSELISGRRSHSGDNLSSFVLIGSRFEISLTDRFGVYGKLLNLLNEDYELWQGYRERGFQGYVGFTVLF